MNPIRRKRQSGFTLLEVMIAMSIMALALSAIYSSQSDGIFRTIKTKELNIAGWLAHNKMVESEHLMEGKPFEELDKGPKSDAFKAPFERFRFTTEVRELKFPELPLGSGKEGEGVSEAVRILSKTITKFLNSSLRELVITVSWDRGNGEQNLVLSTYLIDLNAEFNFAI